MKAVIHILATLTLIGIISGGALFSINDWAAPKIKYNEIEETKKAIFNVQPEAKDYARVEAEGIEVYEVFNDNKETIGYSLAYVGVGFQGNIRLIVGLSADIKKITAMQVLGHTETPGLGDIITKPKYADQFVGLDIPEYIGWIKAGTATPKENEIEAYSGATISQKSVVNILNAGIKHLRSLKEGGKL